MRISSRGTVSTGPAAFLLALLIGVGAVLLAVMWPLALANQHGRIAWWGWPAEAAWLTGCVLAGGVASARRQGG